MNKDINIDVTFNNDVSTSVDISLDDTQTLDITTEMDDNITIEIGHMFTGNCKVVYHTTEYWNSRPDMISEKGYLYVYSDWKVIDGKTIAGIKIGDGQAYLIDLPFTDEIWAAHIDDVIRHITSTERTFWNNKVRCYIDESGDPHNLIFTTD